MLLATGWPMCGGYANDKAKSLVVHAGAISKSQRPAKVHQAHASSRHVSVQEKAEQNKNSLGKAHERKIKASA